MRKVLRGQLVFACLWTLLLLLCFWGQYSVASFTSQEIPNVIEMRSPNGLALTFDKLEILREKAEGFVLSGWHAEKATLYSEASLEEESVNWISTDGEYGKIGKLNIIRGVYFEPSPVNGENRVVVISDALAAKLFGSTNIIGEPIRLRTGLKNSDADIPYVICGIYHTDNTFLGNLAGNGLETVYLPYVESTGQGIEKLYLKTHKNTSVQSIVGEFQALIGLTVGASDIRDLSDMSRLTFQNVRLSLLFMGVIGIVFCGWTLFQKGKQLYRVRLRHENGGWKSALQGGIALLIGIGTALLIAFPFYIPTQSVPYDNIFDLAFYLNEFQAFVHTKHNLLMPDYYGNLFMYSLCVTLCMVVFILVLFCLAFRTWYKVFHIKKEV